MTIIITQKRMIMPNENVNNNDGVDFAPSGIAGILHGGGGVVSIDDVPFGASGSGHDTREQAEESPRRRVQATPYDLALSVLTYKINSTPKPNEGDEAVDGGFLCELADQFIGILEKRDRWIHFHSDMRIEMPCPDFLVQPIPTDVED